MLIKFFKNIWFNPSRRWSKKHWNSAYIEALLDSTYEDRRPDALKTINYLTELKNDFGIYKGEM